MKNKKVLIIIVAVVLVLGVAAYFLAPKFFGEKEVVAKDYYYPIEDYFVVNIKDGGGILFKATVVLVCDSEDVEELIKENEYPIRDKLLFLFRSLDQNTIQSQDIQDRLREQIPAMLNEMMNTTHFKSVLFGDFVMQ